MAEISKITLPNGATYSFKDEVARQAASAGFSLVVVDTLPTASASTTGAIYLVAHTPEADNNFDEYVTISQDGTYSWEKIGTTAVDLSDYSKNTHTHNVTSNVGVEAHGFTPEGALSTPAFTGKSKIINVSGTPSGSVTISEAVSGEANYTPKGTIAAPQAVVNIQDLDREVPLMYLYSMSSTGSYTPSTWEAGSYTKSNYTPEVYEVSNETLLITPSSYTAESITMPIYTKEEVEMPERIKVGADVLISEPVFTGTPTKLEGSFNGDALVSAGSFTPEGSVSKPTFTGKSVFLYHSVTNGSVTSTEAK